MPINVTSSQFVTPSGIDPDENLRETTNRLFQRRLQRERLNFMEQMQGERLQLSQQQKRDEAGKAVTSAFDDKNFLSATIYDPVIKQGVEYLRQRGYEMAAQGMDIPNIMMNLSPDAAKLGQYSNAAKTVRANVQDQLKRMKDNGFKGYNYGDLEDEAMKSAFMEKDPKTGQYSTMKDITKVDPTTNYVHQAIDQDPDKFTNATDLDEYAKNTPMQKTLHDIKSYDSRGGLTANKVHLIGQNYLVPDVDEKGVTTGLVPKYDTAADGGKPILHDFKDAKGNVTSAPIRLLDEGVFDNMMSQKPGVADYIKGQTKKHIAEYTDADGKPIDVNDPRAKNVARAIAYDELKRRANATIEHVQTIDKPSAQQVKLNIDLSPEGKLRTKQNAELRREGSNEAGPAKGPKQNFLDTIGNVFTNDPDYTTGDIKNVDGRNVVDVTQAFPGAKLKADAKNAYSGVYYDPEKRSLLVETLDGKKEEVPENQIGQFATRVATANGMPVSKVRQSLVTIGYKNGKFSSGDSDELLKSRIADAGKLDQEEATKKVDAFVGGDETKLKGMRVPDGKIVSGSVRGSLRTTLGADKFSIDIKNPQGKVVTKTFKTEQELRDYLESSAPAPAEPVKAQPIKKGVLD